ncbi:hypothetical protein JDW21_19310 [Bacillus subtilis]|uniref:hypothetical protein n=1 Tax=Bacillus subtilis TaxID=1423 RepID=UPI002ED41CCA
MGEIIEFNQIPKLYLVDNYNIVLAVSKKEAVDFYKEKYKVDDVPVMLLDNNKVLNVIRSGNVEYMLWRRKPRPSEQLSFTITVGEFIEQYLKKYNTPYSIDVIEDRGAEIPR